MSEATTAATRLHPTGTRNRRAPPAKQAGAEGVGAACWHGPLYTTGSAEGRSGKAWADCLNGPAASAALRAARNLTRHGTLGMVGLGPIRPPQRLRMKQAWHWSRARWWWVDLHLRLPESHDFIPQISETKAWRAWLEAATRASLDAVAVTDHNTADAISELHSTSEGLHDDHVLFPNVETTATEMRLARSWKEEGKPS